MIEQGMLDRSLSLLLRDDLSLQVPRAVRDGSFSFSRFCQSKGLYMYCRVILFTLLGAFWRNIMPFVYSTTYLSAWILVPALVHHAVITLYLVANWAACITSVPDKAEDTTAEREDVSELLILLQHEEGKICEKCRSEEPRQPRAHHCSVYVKWPADPQPPFRCRRCIDRMDHHCPWLNRCIGAGNLHLYVRTLLVLCYSSMCAVFTSFAGIVVVLAGPDPPGITGMMGRWDARKEYVNPAITLSVVCLMVLGVAGTQLGWALFLSWGGITHVEYAKLVRQREQPAAGEGQIAAQISGLGERRRAAQRDVQRMVRQLRAQAGWRNLRVMLLSQGSWLTWLADMSPMRAPGKKL